jgi:hypothetical protein
MSVVRNDKVLKVNRNNEIKADPNDALARIVAPLVQGQIRSFLNDHGHQLRAQLDRDTIIQALSKRIINDLLCAGNRARLASALTVFGVDVGSDRACNGAVASDGAGGKLASSDALPDNVVRLPVITRLDLDPDMVLRRAVGEFKSVVLIGYDHEGEERCCSSMADGPEMLWLLARYQKKLLAIPETWDGDTHPKSTA